MSQKHTTCAGSELAHDQWQLLTVCSCCEYTKTCAVWVLITRLPRQYQPIRPTPSMKKGKYCNQISTPLPPSPVSGTALP